MSTAVLCWYGNRKEKGFPMILMSTVSLQFSNATNFTKRLTILNDSTLRELKNSILIYSDRCNLIILLYFWPSFANINCFYRARPFCIINTILFPIPLLKRRWKCFWIIFKSHRDGLVLRSIKLFSAKWKNLFRKIGFCIESTFCEDKTFSPR